MSDAPLTSTFMEREIAEIPVALARQRDANRAALQSLGQLLRDRDPPLVVTIARGSSDHAALYLKHLVETQLGLPCCSIGPSVASIYRVPLRLAGAVAITISQSGRSPDIIAMQQVAKAGGALTVALVNDAGSPVATEADILLPLESGPEHSVAATKTMVASLFGSAGLMAAWGKDAAFDTALESLPDQLLGPTPLSDDLVEWLRPARSVYVIGRGATHAVAAEAALKLKETAALHAEAFSSAEVLHGPAGIIRPDFPVLCFMAQDAARAGMEATRERLAAMGARCATFDRGLSGVFGLEFGDAGHPALAPIPMLQSFYTLAERLARRRGHDPDVPAHLQKVTQTV